MRVKKMIAAATLPAMMASPVAAANPAGSLSLRDSGEASLNREQPAAQAPIPAAPVEAASAGGISTSLLIGGFALAAIVVGAVVLGRGHHNSHPASA